MVLDQNMRFSNAQALTVDAYSTNIIDLIKTGRRPFVGAEAMCILLLVGVAADHTTGDETYEVQLHTDDDVGFGSPTTLLTQAILYSALTAGAKIVIPLSPSLLCERYLALYYNVGGTTPTVTLSAFLCPVAFVDMYNAFADNIHIG